VVWGPRPAFLALAQAGGSRLPALLLGCSGSRSSGPMAAFVYGFGPVPCPVLLRHGLSRSSLTVSRKPARPGQPNPPHTHTDLSSHPLHRHVAPPPFTSSHRHVATLPSSSHTGSSSSHNLPFLLIPRHEAGKLPQVFDSCLALLILCFGVF
jgi:hypothetical protein